MVQLKKIEIYLCQLFQKKTSPPPDIHQTPSRIHQFFRKNLTPATKRMGEAQITNHSVVLVWNRRTPNMVGDHARKFFIDYYLHSILAQLYWFSGAKTSRYDTVCIHIYMKFKNVIYLNYIYTYIYIYKHTYIYIAIESWKLAWLGFEPMTIEFEILNVFCFWIFAFFQYFFPILF